MTNEKLFILLHFYYCILGNWFCHFQFVCLFVCSCNIFLISRLDVVLLLLKFVNSFPENLHDVASVWIFLLLLILYFDIVLCEMFFVLGCFKIWYFLKEQLEAFEQEKQILLGRSKNAQLEIEKLSHDYAKILGHQNQKQKIHHILKLKEENSALRKVSWFLK